MAFKEPPKVLSLENFDDMMDFGIEKEQANGIVEMQLSDMTPFPNHKFKLYEGQQLDDMIDSIKEFGILLPIILWHTEDGKYIVLSGHNRKRAGELAGLSQSPVIIKEHITHEEAVLIVTETNLRQRSFSDLSISERAYCLSEHYEAMKHQGRRTDILNEIETLLKDCDIEENPTSAENQQKLENRDKLAQSYGLSKDKVARYIRIATLDRALIELLDEGIIGITPAYTISFIDNQEMQIQIADLIENQNYKVDVKKAELLREYFTSNKLTEITIEQILSGVKSKKPKSNKPTQIKVKDTVIKKFFTEGETVKEIEEVIEKALEAFFNKLE